MPYAINAAGDGFRAIDSEADLAAGETYSETLPTLTPSNDEIVAEVKAQARAILVATDYTQTNDVANDLKNAADFVTYRAAVRAIFKAPMTDPTWPLAPDPVWS